MSVSIPTILSIQVGKPAEHGADSISRKTWESGIFKYTVNGKVYLDTLNLMGDGQQDLKNHGGPFRAVLAYGAAHYPVWRDELGRDEETFAYGSFGENFTVSELTEDAVCIGDIYAVGEARVQVAQPRWPCWKLARRNDIKDLAARVEEKGWGGWYHRVLQTGHVEAGDRYELLERSHPDFPIARLNRMIAGYDFDREALLKLARMEELSFGWRMQYGGLAESE